MNDPTAQLKGLEFTGQYDVLIETLRQLVQQDRQVLQYPYVKQWCARRWRNLFLNEAIHDPIALKSAKKKLPVSQALDKREARQQIAERFLRKTHKAEWSLELPPVIVPQRKHTFLIFCPNLLVGFTEVLVSAFQVLQHQYSVELLRVDAHPMRSCQENAEDIWQTMQGNKARDAQMETVPDGSVQIPENIWIVTFSKGMPDLLTFLVAHPEYASRIRCIFNIAGATKGSYNADKANKIIKHLPIEQVRQGMEGLLHSLFPGYGGVQKNLRLDEYDLKGAVSELTTEFRGQFLSEHAEFFRKLPIPVFNLAGTVTTKRVPLFLMADYLYVRKFSKDNDAQLTSEQVIFENPLSIDLGMVKADHFDLVGDHEQKSLPYTRFTFPKTAMILSMFQLSVELGLID